MMIELCKDLQYIRCTKHKYIVKKGSMSNYSFDIIDEKGTGILDIIFERTEYPIDEKEFCGIIEKLLGKEADDFNDKLFELEILRRTEQYVNRTSLLIICPEDVCDLLNCKLEKMNYSIIGFYDLERVTACDNQLANQIYQCDILFVFSNTFRPDIFYEVNKYIVDKGTKTIISYMDGDEGIILPLINPKKYGCYNDFELLRESSFHNLIEYQIMKEEIMKKKWSNTINFYASMLLDWTIVIMNSVCSETYINNFAYSIDFERLHLAKSKLFRFPKCPSCQGDSNLTHPFI